MKKFSLLIICVLLLSACANAVNPISTVTATSIITATFTPIPTITPSPTETPDPNMPLGATGKNSDGQYVKEITENGKPVTYEWNVKLNGWFNSHILPSADNIGVNKDKIPLVEGSGFPAQVPFSLNVSEKVTDMPYLSHTTNFANDGKGLSSAIMHPLYKYRIKNSLGLSKYQSLLYSGEGYEVPFIVSSGGETLIWKTKYGYEVNVIPWNEADPAQHSEFFETPTDKQLGDNITRWNVTVIDGRLVATIAFSNDPSTITDWAFFDAILNPMGMAIDYIEPFPSFKQMQQGWWLKNFPSDYVQRTISTSWLEIHKNPQ